MIIPSCIVDSGSGHAGLFYSQASRDTIVMPSPGTSDKGLDVDVAVARFCSESSPPSAWRRSISLQVEQGTGFF